MAIRVVVWNENIHEKSNESVRRIYPEGIHGCIADFLNNSQGVSASTATLDEAEHGLSEERLAETDVLIWWGHAAHGDVADHVVERVVRRVWEGMGLIVLHSGHFSKIFKRLMGTACSLSWREAGEKERLWVSSPLHPIAQGVGAYVELEHEEMYGEPFSIPEPLETVFIGWFEGGEVFRSGVTYRRGAGNIFYFQPGHETYPTYHNMPVQKVITNAVRWAVTSRPHLTDAHQAKNVPVENAHEKLEAKGASLHADGEEGFH